MIKAQSICRIALFISTCLFILTSKCYADTAAKIVKYEDECAITSNQELYCWGQNTYSRIGIENVNNLLSPTKILPDEKISDINGHFTKCAITTTNKLYCWGDNSTGQVGNSSNKEQATPVQILENESIRDISGENTKCAITKNDKLYCWGDSYSGQVGNGSIGSQSLPVNILGNEKISSVITDDISCAITTDGKLFCWGDNTYGQIGSGSKGAIQQLSPVQILKNETVRSVKYNFYTTCVITTDDKLFCWGANWYGQVGNGLTTDQLTPVQILKTEKVKSIELFDGTACAITFDGKLYCWGSNSGGQVSNNSEEDQLTPTQILKNEKINFLKHKSDTVCAVTIDGKLYCWGSNWLGKVGNGSIGNQLTPVQILKDKKINNVEINDSTTCATTTDNKLYCWGNIYCSVDYQLTPIQMLPNKKIASVSLYSDNTSCAITVEGELYCWGCNVRDSGGNISSSPKLFTGSSSCVDNPHKLHSGVCGCNILDVDTDGDYVADCKDECPDDIFNNIKPQEGCFINGSSIPERYDPKVETMEIATPKTKLLPPFFIYGYYYKKATVYFERFLAGAVSTTATARKNFKYKVSISEINKKIGTKKVKLKTLSSKKNSIKITLRDGVIYKIKYRIFIKAGAKGKYSKWSKVRTVKK